MNKYSFIICIIFFPALTFAVSYPSSQYYSFHLFPKTIQYTTQDNQIESEYRIGFLAQHDITDPKIVCNKDLWDCSYQDNHYFTDYSKNQLPADTFKIFIPPGTLGINLSIYCARYDLIGIAFRHKSPPQNHYTYEDITYSNYSSNYRIEELITKDHFAVNQGGIISIAFRTSTIPYNASGWLYINIIKNLESHIYVIQNSIMIDTDNYINWYTLLNSSSALRQQFIDQEKGSYDIDISNYIISCDSPVPCYNGSISDNHPTTNAPELCVGLCQIIQELKILSGAQYGYSFDINGNNKLDMAEIIYHLRLLSGIQAED